MTCDDGSGRSLAAGFVDPARRSLGALNPPGGDSSASEVRSERDSQLVERLSTPELLGLLLGPPSRAATAARRAWRLLDRFHTIRRLAAATPGELAAAGGLSPENALRLAATFALGRRAAQQRMPIGALFRSSLDIFERYHPILRDAKKERFLVVLLDAKNRVMREEQVSEGHLTSALVHPREVFGVAIRESAGALICVHNHPSGDPEPSTEDVELTRRLVAVGELVGIRILDHLIVGDGAFVSFLDRGWIHP